MRSTVAGEGCWPFFLPVAMTSRVAMSRRLSSWPRRCRATASMASSVTAAPPMALPRARADSCPSRVRSRMYSRSIPDSAVLDQEQAVDGLDLPDGQLYRASPADYWIPAEGAAGLGTRPDPMG